MKLFLPAKYKKSLTLYIALLCLITASLFPLLSSQTSAGVLTPRKLTLSDSRTSATGVTQDYAFTVSATTSIKQIDIQVCTTPSGTCTAAPGFSSGTPTIGSDNIAGTGRTVSAPTSNAFRIVVTTPAAQSTQAVTISFTGTTNPSGTDTTYYARITTYSDTGSTVIDGPDAVAFAILSSTSIAVSASVDPSLTFTIAAVNTGTVNSANINVTTSTANTIPFGTLTSGSTKIAAHDLTVTTNANNGYTTTVKGTDSPVLVSGTNNIDDFNQPNSTPTTWSSPAGTTNSVNTGFFGYTTNDSTLGTGTAGRFTASGGNKWAGTTTSPLEVAYSAAGTNAEVTRIGWQAEINALQAAGAYSGTVILVTTPTY